VLEGLVAGMAMVVGRSSAVLPAPISTALSAPGLTPRLTTVPRSWRSSMRSAERCTLWDELVRDAPGRAEPTGTARLGSLGIVIVLKI
jgi:hypothetical protein